MRLFLILSAALIAFGFNARSSAATFVSEYELLRKLPAASFAPLTDNSQPDAQGFVGFHRRDGKWYEAGMQRSGCWLLIGAVVAGDEKRADAAWKSIEATFARQIEDGGFLSNMRPDGTHPPTFDQRVETAYFYMQELGHAILVLRASPLEKHFHDRIAALEPRLRRACARWSDSRSASAPCDDQIATRCRRIRYRDSADRGPRSCTHSPPPDASRDT